MCSKFELTTELKGLPKLLKANLPNNFERYYAKQSLIKPGNPILVIRKEHKKVDSTFMLWGLLAEWSNNPFNLPRPFNARAETITKNNFFKSSWRHRRCLIPASGFFEKSSRIRKKDFQPFWLAGLWNRWLAQDGSEIESCTVITTEPNELIKPLHNRMPVIIPAGFEESWLNQADIYRLNALEPLLNAWSPTSWVAEPTHKSQNNSQMSLF